MTNADRRRRYRQRHPERVREQLQQWRAKNPVKAALQAIRKNAAKRPA